MTGKSALNRFKFFIQSLTATIETLHDKYIMDQISKSGQDIENGKVRNARDFIEEL